MFLTKIYLAHCFRTANGSTSIYTSDFFLRVVINHRRNNRALETIRIHAWKSHKDLHWSISIKRPHKSGNSIPLSRTAVCEVVAKDPKRLAAHGSVLALFMFLAEMRVPARGGRWGEVGRDGRWGSGPWRGCRRQGLWSRRWSLGFLIFGAPMATGPRGGSQRRPGGGSEAALGGRVWGAYTMARLTYLIGCRENNAI